MLRIIRSRGYGKTYDLIKYALKNDVAIVTHSMASAKQIKEMSVKHFGKEVRAYSLTEWQMEGCHQKNDKYVIDEIELAVRWLLKGHLVGYNMSME